MNVTIKPTVQGYYINLSDATERRNEMERQIEACGLGDNYHRFNAFDWMQFGVEDKAIGARMGCYMSHLAILEMHRDNRKYIHILEDDALIEKSFPGILNSFMNLEFEWDILYTNADVVGCQLPELLKMKECLETFKNKNVVTVIDLGNISFHGTSSYIVNKNSVNKVYELLKEKEREMHVDSRLLQLVQSKKIKAFCSMPFISALSSFSETSLIHDSSLEKSRTNRLSKNFRKALYMNSNLQEIMIDSININKEIEYSPFETIFHEFMKNRLSDDFTWLTGK